MALVDPNIAMGYRGIQLEQRNPLQEYAQVQQIQNAQLQNELARQQMEQEQGAVNYLGKANLATPEGRAGLRQFGKTGLAYEKLLSEQEMNDLKRKELEGKVRDQRMTALGTGLTSVLKDPSDANLTAAFDRLDATGVDTKPFRQSLLSEPDLTKRQSVITQYVTSNPEGRQALTFVQPKPEKMDLNGKIVTIDMNPNSPTYKQQIQEFTKTATIADNLAAAKFAWEKANPNQTIHEDANGLLAVNNRTGVATPVVYGPMGIQTAPAAAPAASMMRQPPAAMPSQRAPAIPGMASVLDQTTAPAAMPVPAEGGVRVPGAPVGGKDKNAPEHFVKTDMQLSGLAGSLKQFKDEVKANPTTGAKWLPTGSDTARMQAKYTSLLMGLKDLYTLGALTGPDMSIIESQITNPASWSGKFTTKKGFEDQIQVVEDMLKRSSANLENAYGRTPKATKKALEALPGGTSSGIPGATETNPLALRIPGA